MAIVCDRDPEGNERVPRQRDRRSAWPDLLAAMSRTLADHTDPSKLRGTFEQALLRMLPVQSIHLRDRNMRFVVPRVPHPVVESVAIDVPGPEGGGLLEAGFQPGSGLGEWDFQALGAAGHLASLVLEIERHRLQAARSRLAPVPKPRRDGAAPLIGRTDAVDTLRQQIERVAATDFTVLVEGESGVGKELVAHQIHDLSRRRTGPFVAINCAALVETLLEAELFGIEDRTATGVRGRRGKFEHADGGTLFLDEVSDLSLSAQAKLLRAIQDLAVERVGGQGTQRVDIRIIAATNRPLGDLVDRRLFRADLFFRLSGVDLRVPPLRERRDDILELAGYFLERHRSTRRLGLSASAADALSAYAWPGNVRELERLIERAVALAEGDRIELDDLPPRVRGDAVEMAVSLASSDTMRAWGSRYARLVLERCGGNKREACRVLALSYHTLNAYLRFTPSSAAHVDESDAGAEAGPPGLQGTTALSGPAEV
ncbi:MAG: sigma 54-interacting transcriptional regulator [Vicinamibacterales bacterium]